MEMCSNPNWYIAYTRPLQEKKVITRFTKKNIEHYCPMKKVNITYSSSQKTIYAPLFTSCVFVHLPPEELWRIKKIWQVINLVHWRDKPVTIKNEEMDILKKFLTCYPDVILEKIPVSNNKMMADKYISFSKAGGMGQVFMNGFAKLLWPSLGYELIAHVGHPDFRTSVNTIQEGKYQPTYLTKLAI